MDPSSTPNTVDGNGTTDTNMNGDPNLQPTATTTTPTTEQQATTASSSSVPPRKMKKKEESFVTNEDLSLLLKSLDSFQPVIPNHIIQHYLSTAGVDTTDESMVKLVSVATQKFITDVCKDAFRYHKIRSSRDSVLRMDDLTLALNDHGVNCAKPQYYT
eukprot:m.11831 g.11831  ORF g.11831 m.11831 type:complete len:159 (-) comp3896_c0_seq1:91-567(-)